MEACFTCCSSCRRPLGPPISVPNRCRRAGAAGQRGAEERETRSPSRHSITALESATPSARCARAAGSRSSKATQKWSAHLSAAVKLSSLCEASREGALSARPCIIMSAMAVDMWTAVFATPVPSNLAS